MERLWNVFHESIPPSIIDGSSIHKLVTDTMNTLDILRPGRVLFDFLPNVSDVAVHRPVGNGQVIGSPDEIEELIPCNDPSFSCNQKLEDLELKSAQAQVPSFLPGFIFTKIQLYLPKTV